jgi:hypothetical protein
MKIQYFNPIINTIYIRQETLTAHFVAKIFLTYKIEIRI